MAKINICNNCTHFHIDYDFKRKYGWCDYMKGELDRLHIRPTHTNACKKFDLKKEKTDER